jgi:ABC-type arginine transport system permease subunit
LVNLSGVKLSAASRALFLQNLCQFLSWNAVTGPVDINILCFASRRDHAFTIAGGGCGSLIKYRSLSRRILRAGFKMLPKGQLEAARDFGFSAAQTLFYIQMPQVLRAMMPALINETIDIIKNSALVSVVAVHELMRVTQTLASTTYRPLEFYTACGLLYFLTSWGLSIVGVRLEKNRSSSAQRVLAQ